MKSKLNLDFKVVDSARQHAANIAHDMQDFIDRHTTVSTERTILRLLGVDGVDEVDNPLPNVVVDQIKEAGALPTGAAYWMGNAIVQTGKTPQEIAEEVGAGKKQLKRLNLSFRQHLTGSTLRRLREQNISRGSEKDRSLTST